MLSNILYTLGVIVIGIVVLYIFYIMGMAITNTFCDCL